MVKYHFYLKLAKVHTRIWVFVIVCNLWFGYITLWLNSVRLHMKVSVNWSEMSDTIDH